VRLSGAVALITGGASGVGLSVAEAFLAEGAQVAVLDRSAASLARVRELMPDVLTIDGDVTKYADNVRAVEETLAAFGRLDTFVGNAGIFDHYVTLAQLPVDDGGAAAFDELINVNVKGYLLGAKAALEPVRAAKGTMIFTASISGLHPGYGGILYIPAKHAVVGLTKRLALELAPDVRVNAVAPGFMPTPLAGTQALAQGQKDPTKLPPADSFLMQRVPTVADYAPLYTFLASRDSIQLVGQVLNADHGLTLQRT
jgi:NAD(P)-dependent dehydrogenase (short-subunit alcohol dehydrogenase family)